MNQNITMKFLFFAAEPIDFLTPLQDVTLDKLGLPAEFSCEVSKQRLKPEWYKGDVKLSRGDKYTMVSEGKTHKLTVVKATPTEEGEYTVVFREDAKSTASLTIKGEMGFFFFFFFFGGGGGGGIYFES